MLDLSILELPSPQLQFGGPIRASDPKAGLLDAGPFDLRFGSARNNSISVGIIGSTAGIESARRWISRIESEIPALGEDSLLKKPFAGFEAIFRSCINLNDTWCVDLEKNHLDPLNNALNEPNPFRRFEMVVGLYGDALDHLAARESNRPDIVLICISDDVLKKARIVESNATAEEKKYARALQKSKNSKQLDFFDLMQEIEQSDEDFLKRDLRHALKARALKCKLPIQIVTKGLLEDSPRGQDPATRAWNFSVGVYYKAGGIPWRLPQSGPETCYVGVSFHHFRTTKRHIVQSSLAQAFSSEGEGFAIRGEGVPAELNQSRDVHLSEEQAYGLAKSILSEYVLRTGGAPLRVVIHKTSYFNTSEELGLRAALKDIPIVDLVTLLPSSFRLLSFGLYPPKVGTICVVNKHRSFVYTSGFMPELGTYPGPHVPQPFEVRIRGGDPVLSANDILNLTRVNWNTADIRGKWPVTLSFARRVGGILDEFGESDPGETSFRYFV